jgi:hypothetical protein
MASLSDDLVNSVLEGRYFALLATQNPEGSIHMVDCRSGTAFAG